MKPKEAVEMMRRCQHEIELLRARIAMLQPKAEAYETISKIVGVAVHPPCQTMGEDLAGILRKRINEIEMAQAAPSLKGEE